MKLRNKNYIIYLCFHTNIFAHQQEASPHLSFPASHLEAHNIGTNIGFQPLSIFACIQGKKFLTAV